MQTFLIHEGYSNWFTETVAKLVTKKKPPTMGMSEALVQNVQRSDSLSDLRLATTCLLSFVGLMSILLDIKIDNTMRIHIVFSKTDQLR